MITLVELGGSKGHLLLYIPNVPNVPQQSGGPKFKIGASIKSWGLSFKVGTNIQSRD